MILKPSSGGGDHISVQFIVLDLFVQTNHCWVSKCFWCTCVLRGSLPRLGHDQEFRPSMGEKIDCIAKLCLWPMTKLCLVLSYSIPAWLMRSETEEIRKPNFVICLVEANFCPYLAMQEPTLASASKTKYCQACTNFQSVLFKWQKARH